MGPNGCQAAIISHSYWAACEALAKPEMKFTVRDGCMVLCGIPLVVISTAQWIGRCGVGDD